MKVSSPSTQVRLRAETNQAQELEYRLFAFFGVVEYPSESGHALLYAIYPASKHSDAQHTGNILGLGNKIGRHLLQ